ncbi:MAG: hypothetical protein SGJ27_09215 [Candidatus Melainabacteria bacterium]|nr:hypothetical protein [Candidatus Melainabacteria bacterium]
MTPEKYIQLAGRLRFLLERLRSMEAVVSRLPDPKDSAAFSRRHMLARLMSNAGNQCKSLTINFGHSPEGLSALASTNVAGTILDTTQVEFIRDQAADELAYKTFYGANVSNDEIINASGLEIEEMLPILTTMVDRCGSLLVNEC